MNLTNEQKNIISSFLQLQKGELLIVNALAGTSKTFTAIECVKNAPANKNVLYLAFNNLIASEMQHKINNTRVSARVDARSIHSLAYNNVKIDIQDFVNRGTFKKVTAYSFKPPHNVGWGGKDALTSQDLCKRLLEEWCRSHYIQFIDFKNACQEKGIDNRALHQVETYWKNIEKRNLEAVPAFFHDQYLKLYQIENPQLKYDIVIIDEAQDLIPCTQSVVNQFLNQGASVVLIGDKYQQINAWIGSINSISSFENKAKCILPLTQSFRCPSNVVTIAQDYLRLLGCDYTFKPCDKLLNNVDKTKTVICRTNSGLIARIFNSGLDTKKIKLIGRNYDFNELKDLLFLTDSLNRADSEIKKNIKNPVVKTFFSLLDYENFSKDVDDSEMIQSYNLYKKFGSDKLKDFLNKIERNQFAAYEEKAELNLCTTHKAKGLEFENVEIDNSFQNFNVLFEYSNISDAPSASLKNKYPQAKYWVSREELCIAYVALTRCSKNLNAGVLQLFNTNNYIEKLKNNELIVYDKMIDGSYVSCNNYSSDNFARITALNLSADENIIVNTTGRIHGCACIKNNSLHGLKVGMRYTLDALDKVFNFSYKPPSGIKIAEDGSIILFVNNSGNKNKDINGVLHFQGQNTGGSTQRLVYGNKKIYDAYNLSHVRIFVFRSYMYDGEYDTCMKPYQENGKWFFPIVKRLPKNIPNTPNKQLLLVHESLHADDSSITPSIKNEFQKYLETRVKQSTAVGYIKKMETDPQKLTMARNCFIDIFKCTTSEIFAVLHKKILNDPNFFAVNARTNGGLSAALNNYKKFLADRDFLKAGK